MRFAMGDHKPKPQTACKCYFFFLGEPSSSLNIAKDSPASSSSSLCSCCLQTSCLSEGDSSIQEWRFVPLFRCVFCLQHTCPRITYFATLLARSKQKPPTSSSYFAQRATCAVLQCRTFLSKTSYLRSVASSVWKIAMIRLESFALLQISCWSTRV